MVGCTRQSSFDAASFREAFRKNSSTTSVVGMQEEDQSMLHRSFVNALEVDITRLGRSGSSNLPAWSSVDCNSERGEWSSSVGSKRIADDGSASHRDVVDTEISVPSCGKGKAKCLPNGEYIGPNLQSADRNVSGQEPDSMPAGTIASRTYDARGNLSFPLSQIDAGINCFSGLQDYWEEVQDTVAGRESPTSVLGGQPRSESKCKAIYCGIHARDYSDCMAFHFIRSLQVSPHEFMMNTVKEALERNRSAGARPPTPTAAETTKVTTGSIFTSSGFDALEVCNAGDSGNPTDDSNAELIGEDSGGTLKNPASGEAGGRKRELSERNVAGERFVKRRTPIESRINPVQQDQGYLLDERFTVSLIQEVFENVNIQNLVGYKGENARVGGCAVRPENLTRSVDAEEDERPPNDANMKSLLDEWENKEIFLMTKDPGDCKEGLDFPMIICGNTYRKQSPAGFAGNCRAQITEKGYNVLEVLGPDVMAKVLSLLDARSLARCGVISKDWKALAHMDSLWDSQCVKLWEGKIHLPCFVLQDGLPKVVAYSRSVQDAKRTQITSKDLCDHIWEFRFKKAAPAYWLRLDPAQRGEAPMKRFFHMDGSQTAAVGDEVWGGHECFYSIIDEVNSDGNKEHFVQINHWPYMSVSRTRDWGWVLNNRVHVYQSIPDPWKQGGTGPDLPVQ